MYQESLSQVAKQMVAPGKGILAADESDGTIKKRFDTINVESTEENRRRYRELLFTTEGLEDYISGIILFDETLRQSTKDGIPFPKLLSDKGIIPGIKVDMGAKDAEDLPGEKVTQGLDGLSERLKEYAQLGARFAKWRAVITIGEGIPTDECINRNADALAKYALACQQAGIVPIVEPEVLMDWTNDIALCEKITNKTLKNVFAKLAEHKVGLSGMILKPNMVISGKECPTQASSREVAEATIRCFKDSVPPEMPGIVFLSGGQTPIQATENLNAINSLGTQPWELSFSYGRALQEDALKAWLGKEENANATQDAMLHRAKMNGLARDGKYSPDMEK